MFVGLNQIKVQPPHTIAHIQSTIATQAILHHILQIDSFAGTIPDQQWTQDRKC